MMSEPRAGLVWAGTIAALSLGGAVAVRAAALDAETFIRMLAIANGLMLAWYGNQTPKRFDPTPQLRRLQRVSGWAMVLGGLVNAAFWTFAPLLAAAFFGTAALLAGGVVTLVHALRLRAHARG